MIDMVLRSIDPPLNSLMGEIKVLNPIPRLSSLKEAVIKTIRDAIITGHFKPGEKLIEKRLTEDLGVSRTILREAISHLSAIRIWYKL